MALRMTRARRSLPLLLGVALSASASVSPAAPRAQVLRLDTTQVDSAGLPVLTTVIDVGEPRRVSDAIASCVSASRAARWDCIGTALEKPNALFVPTQFQSGAAVLALDGAARPAEYSDHASWGSLRSTPRMGTAWLVVLDVDRRMGAGLSIARGVAEAFIESLAPNDAINVMVMDDQQVRVDTHWLSASQKDAAFGVVRSVSLATGTARNRGLARILRTAASDAFSTLPSLKLPKGTPLHQAMVVLSSGYGGTDPGTTGPGGLELARALSEGRFPSGNRALPKAPIPVVSVHFPAEVLPEYEHNAFEFMQALANPEVGGFFDAVEALGDGRSERLVRAVRARFDAMQVVHWRLPCLAPRPTQSFVLAFPTASPAVAGDGSFADVPVGSPLSFPLQVDAERTRAEAQAKGVGPGDELVVYGKFCWKGERQRAKAYFLPRGTVLPESVDLGKSEQAERARQELIAMGLAAEAEATDEAFVRVRVPKDARVLSASGSNQVLRLVLHDSDGPRVSGLTQSTVLELPARAPSRALVVLALVAAGLAGLGLLFAMKRSGRRQSGRAGPTS